MKRLEHDPFEGQRAGGHLHRAIAQRLGAAIIAGRFAPGDALDTEVEASRALSVSRSAYREAICILHAKGLVDSRRKAGTRVNAKRRWNLLDPELLSWAFSPAADQALVQSLLELRLIVEPQAAALAAERRGDSQLESLRRALISAEQHSSSGQQRHHAELEFHHLVLEATGNDTLIALSGAIAAAIEGAALSQGDASPTGAPMAPRWRVFDAIAGRNPEAARRAMRQLIQPDAKPARPDR